MTIISPEVLDFERDILPLTGELRFPLTHDLMFTKVFQRNLYALKGFLSSKLGLEPDSITSLEILNPIDSGDDADDKGIVLDVKIRLNNDTIIIVEMQATRYDYLPGRFLFQLCRVYSDSIDRGDSYDRLPPVVHIAIMDCELFPKSDPRHTEDFLSEYYLMDTKNHKIYAGNFHMEVVSLKYMENAADKEDPNGVYQWAKLFKATTWEEVKMIARNNDYIKAMATSVCALCNDPQFVAKCERRFLSQIEYNSMMSEANRKGMEQGLERGRTQAMKQDIEILLHELGDIPEDILARIDSETDVDTLRKWLKAAAKADSVEDFLDNMSP